MPLAVLSAAFAELQVFSQQAPWHRIPQLYLAQIGRHPNNFPTILLVSASGRLDWIHFGKIISVVRFGRQFPMR